MNHLAPALAFAAAMAVPLLHAATLDTRTYTVEITALCGERVTDCEQGAWRER